MLYTSLVWEQHRAFQAESMLGASISHCLWEFAMLMLWQISIFTHLVNKKMAWCWFNLQFFNVRVRVHVFPGHPDFIWGYLPIHMLCSLFYGASHHNLTHLKHSLWKKFSFFVISFCYISIFFILLYLSFFVIFLSCYHHKYFPRIPSVYGFYSIYWIQAVFKCSSRLESSSHSKTFFFIQIYFLSLFGSYTSVNIYFIYYWFGYQNWGTDSALLFFPK